MDDGKLDALGQTIASALPGAVTGHAVTFNQLTIVCPRASSLASSMT